MANIQNIIDKIELAAAKFGTTPSVVSAKIGQGGRFHARLADGKQAWASTLDAADDKLDAMIRLGTLDLPLGWCDTSHGCDAKGLQDAQTKDASGASKVAS